MAGSVNKVIVLGNLGQDPETRIFQNGGSVTNLSVATSESWKDKSSGERKERTEWHRVSILNDTLGEIVTKYARKGDKIYIEGQLQTRKYTDNAGVERFSTEIVVKGFNSTVQLLGERRSNGNSSTDRQNGRDDEYQPPQPRSRPAGNDLDDEIPF
jgi:single-strand DNA-binding protein